MRTWWVVAACATLLVLVGCGSSSTGTPGAESSVAGQTGGADSGTGPDSPVDAGNQGVADLPSLPIGGDAAFESANSPICATVAFTWGGGDLPHGVVVRISGLSYPEGVGVAAGVSCDGPPCLHADSFTADRQSCTVGLTWDGTTTGDPESLTIGASGSVTCDSQDACDQVRAQADAQEGEMSVELPAATDPSSESS